MTDAVSSIFVAVADFRALEAATVRQIALFGKLAIAAKAAGLTTVSGGLSGAGAVTGVSASNTALTRIAQAAQIQSAALTKTAQASQQAVAGSNVLQKIATAAQVEATVPTPTLAAHAPSAVQTVAPVAAAAVIPPIVETGGTIGPVPGTAFTGALHQVPNLAASVSGLQDFSSLVGLNAETASGGLDSVVGKLDALSKGAREGENATQLMSSGFQNLGVRAHSAIGELDDVNRGAEQLWKNMRFGRLAAGGLAVGLLTGTFALAKMGIAFDKLKQQETVSFTSLLGNAKAATDLLNRVEQTAVRSPFTIPQYTDAVRTLLTAGFSTKQVLQGAGVSAKGLIVDIGDAAAAQGPRAAQALDSIASVFAHVNSTGKITTLLLRQLSSAGIDVQKVLKEGLGLTTQQIQNLTAQKIDVGPFLASIATQFHKTYGGTMLKDAHTFTGAITTLRDELSIGLGNAFTSTFSKSQAGLTGIVNFLNSFDEAMQKKGFMGALQETSPGVYTVIKNLQDVLHSFVATLKDAAPVAKAFIAVFAGLAAAGIVAALTAAGVVLHGIDDVLRALPGPVKEFLGGVLGLVFAFKALSEAKWANVLVRDLKGALVYMGLMKRSAEDQLVLDAKRLALEADLLREQQLNVAIRERVGVFQTRLLNPQADAVLLRPGLAGVAPGGGANTSTADLAVERQMAVTSAEARIQAARMGIPASGSIASDALLPSPINAGEVSTTINQSKMASKVTALSTLPAVVAEEQATAGAKVAPTQAALAASTQAVTVEATAASEALDALALSARGVAESASLATRRGLTSAVSGSGPAALNTVAAKEVASTQALKVATADTLATVAAAKTLPIALAPGRVETATPAATSTVPVSASPLSPGLNTSLTRPGASRGPGNTTPPHTGFNRTLQIVPTEPMPGIPTGAQALSEGGFSIHPQSGEKPTSGYMVGIPGHSQFTPITDPKSLEQQAILTKQLADYVAQNQKMFEQNPALYLGGWHDTAHQQFVTDPSENIQNLEAAKAKAVAGNQQSIWDVTKGSEIPTGGTGTWPVVAAAPRESAAVPFERTTYNPVTGKYEKTTAPYLEPTGTAVGAQRRLAYESDRLGSITPSNPVDRNPMLPPLVMTPEQIAFRDSLPKVVPPVGNPEDPIRSNYPMAERPAVAPGVGGRLTFNPATNTYERTTAPYLPPMTTQGVAQGGGVAQGDITAQGMKRFIDPVTGKAESPLLPFERNPMLPPLVMPPEQTVTTAPRALSAVETAALERHVSELSAAVKSEDTAILSRALAGAGIPSAETLYRGTNLAPGKALAQYKPGDVITLPPTSFSSSQGVAESFERGGIPANAPMGLTPDEQVAWRKQYAESRPYGTQFHLAPGAPTISPGAQEFAYEQEKLSGGPMQVSSVTKDPVTGRVTIALKALTDAEAAAAEAAVPAATALDTVAASLKEVAATGGMAAQSSAVKAAVSKQEAEDMKVADSEVARQAARPGPLTAVDTSQQFSPEARGIVASQVEQLPLSGAVNEGQSSFPGMGSAYASDAKLTALTSEVQRQAVVQKQSLLQRARNALPSFLGGTTAPSLTDVHAIGGPEGNVGTAGALANATKELVASDAKLKDLSSGVSNASKGINFLKSGTRDTLGLFGISSLPMGGALLGVAALGVGIYALVKHLGDLRAAQVSAANAATEGAKSLGIQLNAIGDINAALTSTSTAQAKQNSARQAFAQQNNQTLVLLQSMNKAQQTAYLQQVAYEALLRGATTQQAQSLVNAYSGALGPRGPGVIPVTATVGQSFANTRAFGVLAKRAVGQIAQVTSNTEPGYSGFVDAGQGQTLTNLAGTVTDTLKTSIPQAIAFVHQMSVALGHSKLTTDAQTTAFQDMGAAILKNPMFKGASLSGFSANVTTMGRLPALMNEIKRSATDPALQVYATAWEKVWNRTKNFDDAIKAATAAMDALNKSIEPAVITVSDLNNSLNAAASITNRAAAGWATFTGDLQKSFQTAADLATSYSNTITTLSNNTVTLDNAAAAAGKTMNGVSVSAQQMATAQVNAIEGQIGQMRKNQAYQDAALEDSKNVTVAQVHALALQQAAEEKSAGATLAAAQAQQTAASSTTASTAATVRTLPTLAQFTDQYKTTLDQLATNEANLKKIGSKYGQGTETAILKADPSGMLAGSFLNSSNAQQQAFVDQANRGAALGSTASVNNDAMAAAIDYYIQTHPNTTPGQAATDLSGKQGVQYIDPVTGQARGVTAADVISEASISGKKAAMTWASKFTAGTNSASVLKQIESSGSTFAKSFIAGIVGIINPFLKSIGAKPIPVPGATPSGSAPPGKTPPAPPKPPWATASSPVSPSLKPTPPDSHTSTAVTDILLGKKPPLGQVVSKPSHHETLHQAEAAFNRMPAKIALDETAISHLKKTGDVHQTTDAITRLEKKLSTEKTLHESHDVQKRTQTAITEAKEHLKDLNRALGKIHADEASQTTLNNIYLFLLAATPKNQGGTASNPPAPKSKPSKPSSPGGAAVFGIPLTPGYEGSIKTYARGGISRLPTEAVIEPQHGPKGILSWAESAAGPWEAFIPGSESKRANSSKIWKEVGQRLGFMDGSGLVTLPMAQGGFMAPQMKSYDSGGFSPVSVPSVVDQSSSSSVEHNYSIDAVIQTNDPMKLFRDLEAHARLKALTR